jgi:hypothetical protein
VKWTDQPLWTCCFACLTSAQTSRPRVDLGPGSVWRAIGSSTEALLNRDDRAQHLRALLAFVWSASKPTIASRGDFRYKPHGERTTYVLRLETRPRTGFGSESGWQAHQLAIASSGTGKSTLSVLTYMSHTVARGCWRYDGGLTSHLSSRWTDCPSILRPVDSEPVILPRGLSDRMGRLGRSI